MQKQTLSIHDAEVSIPLPLYLVVEDVGWWRGEDGSFAGQPYRNRFCRDHCLADYMALTDLAQKLSMRIGIAMVLCEWIETDYLETIPGAVWPGQICGADPDRKSCIREASLYLQKHSRELEIALHGLCHEYWLDGTMSRSEFHDELGQMRPAENIRAHLNGFRQILQFLSIGQFPHLFVPPALNHSFGNGSASVQTLLADFGIRFVITRFSRARRYTPPLHQMITWEEGVVLLERGEAPVSWHEMTAQPPSQMHGPVIALHWGNLLHRDPLKNYEVIAAWAEALLDCAARTKAVIAADVHGCFRQCAAHYLAEMSTDNERISIDLQRLPSYTSLSGTIWLRIEGDSTRRWNCEGATCIQIKQEEREEQLLEILPEKSNGQFTIYPL